MPRDLYARGSLMRLLFDQNLSYKLCVRLADVFPDAEHVRAVGLAEADDRAVWSFARDNNHVLVTRRPFGLKGRDCSARPAGPGRARRPPSVVVSNNLWMGQVDRAPTGAGAPA
ncbi:MAG: hypothetical protein FJX72_17535 [Armatimonadetes bacterium]|nr:hypothetical protein [Armatimonadota bacterium]